MNTSHLCGELFVWKTVRSWLFLQRWYSLFHLLLQFCIPRKQSRLLRCSQGRLWLPEACVWTQSRSHKLGQPSCNLCHCSLVETHCTGHASLHKASHRSGSETRPVCDSDALNADTAAKVSPRIPSGAHGLFEKAGVLLILSTYTN